MGNSLGSHTNYTSFCTRNKNVYKCKCVFNDKWISVHSNDNAYIYNYGKLVKTISNVDIGGFTVSADEKFCFLSNWKHSNILKLDLITKKVTLFIAGDWSKLYDARSTLSRYPSNTLFSCPHSLSLDPNGNLLATDRHANVVYRINIHDGTVLEKIHRPNPFYLLQFVSSDTHLLTINELDHQVYGDDSSRYTRYLPRSICEPVTNNIDKFYLVVRNENNLYNVLQISSGTFEIPKIYISNLRHIISSYVGFLESKIIHSSPLPIIGLSFSNKNLHIFYS